MAKNKWTKNQNRQGKKTLTAVYKQSIFVNMRYHPIKALSLWLYCAIACLFWGCSNSEGIDYAEWDENSFAKTSSSDVEEKPVIIDHTPQEIEDLRNDSVQKENNTNDNKVNTEKNIKDECFDKYRLPKLESESCKKIFFTPDTVKDFPESGFFQKTFTIEFPDNKKMNCEVGGNVPTKESPLTSTLQIDSSITIRCADFSGKSASAEIIRTYILEKKPTIPAVFITTDPNSLFNPDTGIYMEGPNAGTDKFHSGANYWLDKEIPIFIELTETRDDVPAFSKYAGLKIIGHYSRAKAKKSVAISFKKKYGDNRLNYMLFPEFPELITFKSFVLRNNGNNFSRDYIRDRLASSISEGLNVDYRRGRFVTTYYNGKYFGIHDLRERTNEYYFETHYNMNHNNINLLSAHNSVSVGFSDDYISLINWLKKNSLEKDENYDHIASKIDVDNFINYMHVEIFANNRDWPGNNLKKWNCTNPQTLWKWILYDLDVSFGIGSDVSNNIFNFLSSEGETNYANAPQHTLLFRSLLENKNFRESFINRLTTLLQMNFESSRVLSQIEKMMTEINDEIPYDQKRWSLRSSKMDEELGIIKQFAKDRPSHLIKHLQEYFKLEETIPVTLSTKGKGTILVHNLPLDRPSLTIPFFKNFPVTITAEPQDGSSWSHWSDGNKEATRTIIPGQSNELTAIFK